MTIKVGDIVRVKMDSNLFATDFDGRTGTVIAINYDRDRVEVRFDDGEEDYGVIEDVVVLSTIPVDNTSVKEKLAQIEALVAEIKTILG